MSKKGAAAMFNTISGRIPYAKAVILLAFLNLSTIAFVILVRNSLPPVVPLLYGNPEGEHQLAETVWLITPSSISLAVISVNTIFCLFKIDIFLKRVLIISTIAVSFLTLVATFKIVFLVGSLY